MLFRYSLRSLWAHKTDTLFSLVGIAAVTWACLTCLAFVFRFNDAMHAAGKHDNVIVLQQSARRETFSWIDKQIYDQLRAFPGIKSEEGRDLVSAEYVGH